MTSVDMVGASFQTKRLSSCQDQVDGRNVPLLLIDSDCRGIRMGRQNPDVLRILRRRCELTSDNSLHYFIRVTRRSSQNFTMLIALILGKTEPGSELFLSDMSGDKH